jgi:hypothetical protein
VNYKFKLSRRLAGMKGAALVAYALSACAPDGSGLGLTIPDSTSTSIASLSVTPAVDTLDVGAARAFAAIARDAGGAIVAVPALAWASSDTTVAQVAASGMVQARAAGFAIISASAAGRADSATLRVVAAPVAPRAGWYAAPGGSASGDGSQARPWSLAAALSGASGRVRPGDTVWVRGGTYTGTFTSAVAGAANRLVVFRAVPGERAILDGRGSARTATTLRVEGGYVAFWGLEITNSDPSRTWGSAGNGGRAHAIYNKASHTRYINLVVHDAGVALYSDPTTADVDIAGCLFYNNGWQGPDRGHGHAIYVRSNSGPVTARDNIMFGQFGYGVHVYSNPGEGYLNNVRIEGNVAFNNGTLSSNGTAANILVGGDERADNDAIVANATYHSPGVSGNNVEVGFGTLANGSMELRNNRMVGGSPVLEIGYWSSATISGNALVGSGTLVALHDNSLASYSWSGSQYYRDPLSAAWSYRGTTTALAVWQSATSLGSTGTASASAPAASEVIVRANPYERGRAHVVVYNWAGASAASVNVAGIVPAGARYTVRNAQQPFGPAVASGTYGGGAISVPLTAVQPPAPIGWSTRAPSTGTQFHVFIVTTD